MDKVIRVAIEEKVFNQEKKPVREPRVYTGNDCSYPKDTMDEDMKEKKKRKNKRVDIKAILKDPKLVEILIKQCIETARFFK